MRRVSGLIALLIIPAVACVAVEPVTIGLDTADGLTIVPPAGFEYAAYSFGPVPSGGGATGSRDGTARLWR